MKNEKIKSRIVPFAVILLISVFAAIAVTPVSAWSPYTGPKEPTSPSPHHTVIADPIGDTYGTGAVQHDITSFSAYYTTTELIVSVTFAGAISPSNSGQPDAVVGFIDFDTDQDPTTGMPSNVDDHSPYTTGLGVDYFVCLGCDPTTGDTIVFDDTCTEVGRAPVSFTSDSFTVRVPLALIGGDDGIVDTATVLGTFGDATDACPNGGYITSSSPWHEINTKLDSLKDNVSAASMPNIIKQRLIDKLEYAKELKENAHEEYEAGNIDAATKKLGVAKSQVESFASMVEITRRISPADKASFLADAAAIIAMINELIEDIETGP